MASKAAAALVALVLVRPAATAQVTLIVAVAAAAATDKAAVAARACAVVAKAVAVVHLYDLLYASRAVAFSRDRQLETGPLPQGCRLLLS